MYAWIWRKLPGSVSLRIIQLVVLFVIVAALLLFVVFPWVEPMLPIDDGGATG